MKRQHGKYIIISGEDDICYDLHYPRKCVRFSDALSLISKVFGPFPSTSVGALG